VSILSGLEGVELRGRVIFYADCLPVPVPVPMASAAHASGAELPTARCRWDLGPLCACASGRGRPCAVPLHVATCLPLPPPAWMPGARTGGIFLPAACVTA